MPNKLTSEFLKETSVVIIDDDINSLDVASIVMNYAGVSTKTAYNGAEGLRLIRELTPTFILSDISMPVMDGWTLIREIREDATLSKIPVIALTAHAMIGDSQKVLDAGFDGYLTKPLQPSLLINHILMILERSSTVISME